jgi:hypothetical protein
VRSEAITYRIASVQWSRGHGKATGRQSHRPMCDG